MANPNWQPNFNNLQTNDLLKICKFSNGNDLINGYLVQSTAPLNVEDDNNTLSYITAQTCETTTLDTAGMITQIAEFLTKSEEPEVIIKIHGYATSEQNAIKQYKNTYNDIYKDFPNNNTGKKFIFLGYRWPSEPPGGIQYLFSALPILPRTLVLFFGVLGIISLNFVGIVPTLLFSISIFFLSVISTLVILRFTVYYRDSYRATKYAVSDLVELIRNLDKAIVEIKPEWNNTSETSKENPVKLSFVAHSMGCYVTTDIIKMLSDLFEPNAIVGKPSSNIGNVFSLGRLILVAPDIPIEAIMPRRANFLRSSLLRYKESYVFSNEGDIVLRLASTTANYFSFPAKTRFSGYRLGNITARHFDKKGSKERFNQDNNNTRRNKIKYGIVNLGLNDSLTNIEEPFNYLEIRSSDKEHQNLEEFPPQRQGKEAQRITNLFTYFDCTDYTDDQSKSTDKCSPVSQALQKPALNLFDYLKLFIVHLILHKIDTHGGYFEGDFINKTIYQLAFFGFDGLLNLDEPDKTEQLNQFSAKYQEKKIQVILSPARLN